MICAISLSAETSVFSGTNKVKSSAYLNVTVTGGLLLRGGKGWKGKEKGREAVGDVHPEYLTLLHVLLYLCYD